MVLAVSAPVLCDPLKDLGPLQPPDAVQRAAFEELQVSVAVAPRSTLVCEDVMDAVGGGSGGADEPPPPQDTSSSADIAPSRR